MTDERNYWDSFRNRRLSRRRAIHGAGLAGIGLTTAAVIGCGDDDDDDDGGSDLAPTTNPTAPGAGQTAKPGGTLKLHMGGSPRSLDAHFDTFPYNTAVTNNTNERLLRFVPDLTKIETELAANMPETPDPLTFTTR